MNLSPKYLNKYDIKDGKVLTFKIYQINKNLIPITSKTKSNIEHNFSA